MRELTVLLSSNVVSTIQKLSKNLGITISLRKLHFVSIPLLLDPDPEGASKNRSGSRSAQTKMSEIRIRNINEFTSAKYSHPSWSTKSRCSTFASRHHPTVSCSQSSVEKRGRRRNLTVGSILAEDRRREHGESIRIPAEWAASGHRVRQRDELLGRERGGGRADVWRWN